jgi:hypothetical protein
MKPIICLLAALTLTFAANAQDKKEQKSNEAIVLNTDGIRYEKDVKGTKKEKSIDVTFATVDVGINTLQDNTNYSTAIAAAQLQVPVVQRNSSLFDLRTEKSMNVNIWPVMGKGRLLKTSRQKIYLSTGVGVQIYNFRYANGIDYVPNGPTLQGIGSSPITYDNTNFKKNKLVVTYLSVPLNLTFKTKMVNKLWLVYGFGVTGGFRINSYTKQVSDLRGKQREHGNFNLSQFNSAVTAEFGLDNYFRLYASYQLTNMYNTTSGLDQHPFCIGLRFGGI